MILVRQCRSSCGTMWRLNRWRIACAALAWLATEAGAGIAWRAASQASQAATTNTTIAYVGAGGASSGTGGNRTPTLPASVAANDLLLCQIASRDNTAPTMPASWSQRFSLTNGSGLRSTLFWKIAGAGESNPTITYTGSVGVVAQCHAFRGIDTSSPFDASFANPGNVGTVAGDDKMTTGTIINATSGAMMLIFGAANDKSGSDNGIATDGGLSTWSDPGEFSVYDPSSSANDLSIAMAYAGRPASGTSFGPVSLDTNRDADTVSVLVALKPLVAGNNALSIDVPSGTTAGDVMIATLVTTPYSVGFTAPAGWTLIRDTPHSSSGGNSHIATYYRVAGSSEPVAYAWAFSTNHSGAAGGIVSYSGVDSSSPIVTSAELKENGNTTLQTAPSIAVSAGDMLLTAHSFKSSRRWTPPSGMIEDVDVYSQAAEGSSGVALEMNHRFMTAAGASGTKVATASGSGDEGASHALALKSLLAVTCVSNTPTTCANDTGIGSVAWSNPGNASGSDNSYASRATSSNSTITNYLKCSGYGFSLPAATIDAIDLGVERYASNTSSYEDSSVRLVRAGTVHAAANGANSGSSYPSSDPGSSDWHGGETGFWTGTWTASDINDTNFGAAFAAISTTGNSRTVYVDSVPVRVCYSAASSTLHHLEIADSTAGSGLTCTPSTLTIRACAVADCTSLYTGGVSGTLTASAGTANWGGGSAAFAIASGSSSTTKTLQLTTPTAATLGISTPSPSPAAATTCPFPAPANNCAYTAADSGFLFDVPDHVAETSQTVGVSAVRKADNSTVCTPAFQSVTKSLTFVCAYSNPASGSLPVRVGGAALNAANNAAAACDGSGRAVSLAFNASGVASTSVQYADVGKLSLSASYVSSAGSDSGLSMSGSDTFVSAPASFAISGVTASPIRAGSNFSATVTARNSAGNATPNFGKESAAESVALSFSKYQPTGSGASAGSFPSVSVGTFAAGVGSATTLNWSEVGSGDLNAALSSGDYLASEQNPSSATFAPTGSTGASGALRFQPHHFDTSVTPACATFSYAGYQDPVTPINGQPFSVTVTAKNSGGNTTVNYDGTANTAPNFALATLLSDANAVAGTLNNTAIATTAFTAGVATLSTPVFNFSTRPTAESTLKLRAIDADVPAVSSSGFSEGDSVVRSGRARIGNAFGSAVLPLTLPIQSEYYKNASERWVSSSGDNCAKTLTLPTAANSGLLFGSQTSTNQLASGEIAADVGGTTSGAVSLPFALGAASIKLRAPANAAQGPGAANFGHVDVDFLAAGVAWPGWLPPAQANGKARAEFGLYKGSDRFIYRREIR